MKPEQLLRLYPRAWRERYAAEVLALIEQSGDRGWRLAIDLMRGCAGAWIAAPFDWMSLKAKQWWCGFAASLAGWVLGLVATAWLALWVPLPSGHTRTWLAVGSILASLGLLLWVTLGPTRRRLGLARAIPNLRPIEAVFLTLAALVFGTVAHLPSVPEFLAGRDSWSFYLFTGIGPCVLFQPLGLSVAALIWPHAFRDLSAESSHRPPSILGLGA